MHPGTEAILEEISDSTMQQKLMDMGCIPGEVLRVDRIAPLGCPMAISVAGTQLSIRMSEADSVWVKPL